MSDPVSPQQVAQLGNDFACYSPEFLSEQLERQYTNAELLQFTENAAATMLAFYYVNFRKAFGKEAAETWVKKVLSLCTSSVRLMGADAMVKFDVQIKDMPNKVKKDVQIVEPQAPPAEPKCECRLFADKSCPICVEKLSMFMKATFKLIREIGNNGKKMAEICQVCAVQQTDRALVRLVPDFLSMKKDIAGENKDAFNHEILAALHQLGAMVGAVNLPLTDQAWMEAVQEKE